jgi:hypothetical protein
MIEFMGIRVSYEARVAGGERINSLLHGWGGFPAEHG